LRPEDLPPSDDQLEVVSAFNPGAVEVNGEVVLLIRVAERPKERREGFTALPRWVPGNGVTVDWLPNHELDFLDPRLVNVRASATLRLTFVSHLAVAHSRDGRTIDSMDDVRLMPENPNEAFGIEDPRITRLVRTSGERYYFTYVAASAHGAATALGSTGEFKTFHRHGIIFPPENKDVTLFPEQIDGKFVAFHRPNPAMHFSPPEMWLAYSADLIHWGEHQPFHAGAADWETGKIGAGCPPLHTDEGWLEIYHGTVPSVRGVGMYSAGALLMDLNEPQRVLRRSTEPIMVPETEFEQEGFVGGVVFPTGIIDRGDMLQVYYGAADTCVGVVEWSKRELLDSLH
jgi:predicted GH43/DUF377 family glycosyl hydrolase